MSRSATWLLGLLGLLVLCVVCVAFYAPRIERDIAARAQAELTLSGLEDAVTLSVSGRDVTLRGEDNADLTQAREVISGVLGVRQVLVGGPSAPLPEVELDGPFALMPLAGGGLALRGAVPDDATRTALLDAARDAFPGVQIRDGLALDTTASGDWADHVTAAMSRMKAVDDPGLAIARDGALVLSGTVDGEGTRRNVESRVAEVIAPRAVRNGLVLVGADVPLAEPTTPDTTTAAAPDTSARQMPPADTSARTPRAPAARRDSTPPRPPAPSTRGAGQVEVQNALPSDSDAQALARDLRQRLGRGTVTFESGSDRLTAGSREVLARAAAALKANPEIAIELQAHTDSEGPAAANQRLSEARARAAKRALVDAGAAPEQLLAAGYGESTAIADNDTEAGRAKNRRVVFKLLRRR